MNAFSESAYKRFSHVKKVNILRRKMNMEIVTNRCYGGFGLSDAFVKYLNSKYKTESGDSYTKYSFEQDRTNPILVNAIKEFGCKKASAKCAQLYIDNIPDETSDFEITKYDGCETITYVLNSKLLHC